MSATARFQASALRVGRRFGTTATLTKIATTYDNGTMTTTETPTNHTVAGVTMRPKMVAGEDGSMIESGELQAVIPALSLASGVVPQTDDKLTLAGVTYAVGQVYSIAPAGVATRYALDLSQVQA